MVRGAASAHHREVPHANDCFEAAQRPVSGDHRKANLLLLTSVLGIGGAEIVIRDLARHLDRDRFNVSVCCLKALGPTGAELARGGCRHLGAAEHRSGSRGLFHRVAIAARPARQTDRRCSQPHHPRTRRRGRVSVPLALGEGCPHVPLWQLPEPAGPYAADGRGFLSVCGSPRGCWSGPARADQTDVSAVRSGDQCRAERRAPAGVSKRRSSIPAQHRCRRQASGRNNRPLCPQKGLHDLLSVARRVRDARHDVHFVLVGGGDLRGELEQRRHDLGLDETVTFTGVLTNAASRALPSFDIYFQPSLWEAMSISVLEAMAAGKSIVSTDVGEAPHLIDHGTEGFLCKPARRRGHGLGGSRAGAGCPSEEGDW